MQSPLGFLPPALSYCLLSICCAPESRRLPGSFRNPYDFRLFRLAILPHGSIPVRFLPTMIHWPNRCDFHRLIALPSVRSPNRLLQLCWNQSNSAPRSKLRSMFAPFVISRNPVGSSAYSLLSLQGFPGSQRNCGLCPP